MQLAPFGGPYLDGDGKPRTDLLLRPGEVIMMPEQEVRGQTWLYDPSGNNAPVYLGSGRVIQSQDGGKSAEELSSLGYQFHEGRADFEEVVKSKKTAATKPQEVE